MIKDGAYWIQKLGMEKHTEGGFFKETYRTNSKIKKNNLPDEFNGDRHLATAIYFLLNKNEHSTFHKLKADEIWHYYTGSSLILYLLPPGGTMEIIHLGTDLEAGEEPQAIIKNNTWFAAELKDKTSFGLYGCTTSPGFEYKDFEIADKKKLLAQYPQHKDILNRLTR